MQLKVRTILMLLVASLWTTIQAEENQKEITITVSGSGKTMEVAKKSALKSALELSFEVLFPPQKSTNTSANNLPTGITIKSYEVLQQLQLSDSVWVVNLKALLPLDQLTKAVQSSGMDLKKVTTALTNKQQWMHEQAEVKNIVEMVGLLHEPLQQAFDYTIRNSQPQRKGTDAKISIIPLKVTETANQKIDLCAHFVLQSLEALTLSAEECNSYKTARKKTFTVSVNYLGTEKVFTLRKATSIRMLNLLSNHWDFYTQLFSARWLQTELTGNWKVERVFAMSGKEENDNQAAISFPTANQLIASFSIEDERALPTTKPQLKYSVKALGIVSPFKQGGYVVKEQNGHGLVIAIGDLSEMTWDEAVSACNRLKFHGYNNWRLPTKDELNFLYKESKNNPFWGFTKNIYWSSSEEDDDDAWFRDFGTGATDLDFKDSFYRIRVVRRY